MSYEKTIWQSGDTITAEKLNNIENGIEAADKPVYAPETVAGEGDVSVTYNGDQIGVLSDSGTLTLDTEGKIAEHGIGIEYTKPAGMPQAVPFTYTNNTSDVITREYGIGQLFKIDDGKIVYADLTDAEYTIAEIGKGNEYDVNIYLVSHTDKYNVTLNGSPVAYDNGDQCYRCSLSSETYPTQFSIIVNLKA